LVEGDANMKNRLWCFLSQAARSRSVYLLVVFSACLVAYEFGHYPYVEHGLASCVAPKAEEEFIGFHFSDAPPLWKKVVVVANVPPLFVSVFATESLEQAFPQLCRYMTFFNWSLVVLGFCLQWALVVRGVTYILSKMRQAS
jgi:hypothetical protein